MLPLSGERFVVLFLDPPSSTQELTREPRPLDSSLSHQQRPQVRWQIPGQAVYRHPPIPSNQGRETREPRPRWLERRLEEYRRDGEC